LHAGEHERVCYEQQSIVSDAEQATSFFEAFEFHVTNFIAGSFNADLFAYSLVRIAYQQRY
jgi:hypothetical protein